MVASFRHSLLRFKFSNFERLPLGIQTYADRTLRDCNGNKNAIGLSFEAVGASGPTTGDAAVVDDKWLSITLLSEAEVEDVIQVSFILRGASGKVVHEDDSRIKSKGRYGRIVNDEFVRRSEVLDAKNGVLQRDGSLILEVDLQYKPKASGGGDADGAHYVPPNPLERNLLKLLDGGAGADVVFKVRGEEIPAHRLIVGAGSPVLANFWDTEDSGSNITTVEIHETSPRAFRHVLRYIYGETSLSPERKRSILDNDWQEVIVACDRYSVDGLKLLVESLVVRECAIDSRNVADYLLFSDAKTCPLIKEYCTAYFLERAEDILDSPHSNKLQESAELLKELMIAVLRKPKVDSILVGTGGPSGMTVDSLRRELARRGLDVDGSRAMLVKRLEESNDLMMKSTENWRKRRRVGDSGGIGRGITSLSDLNESLVARGYTPTLSSVFGFHNM